MPNILIEMGYVSNKAEAKFLKQKGNQTKIAQAIYNGIAQYKEQVESTI
jgi:N-acetylmuramoyl-L-alanine amidase